LQEFKRSSGKVQEFCRSEGKVLEFLGDKRETPGVFLGAIEGKLHKSYRDGEGIQGIKIIFNGEVK
jgi:hypothetical protein